MPYGQHYQTPEVRAVINENRYYVVSLVREPNSWELGIEPWSHSQTFGGGQDFLGPYATSWVFVLDSTAAIPGRFEPDQALSLSQYNGSFRLELNWRDSLSYAIDVPPTESVFSERPRMAISGRLSGNWVMEGASDQGVVLAISELVPNAVPELDALLHSPLVMFLSWFTYDTAGNMLWLTGAAQFAMGATEVTVPIDIGLGSGTQRLQRLYSLEPAGFVCRDLEARILTK